MTVGYLKNWKEVLLKSWSVWVAFIGVVLPDLANLVLTNMADIPLSPEQKNIARLACLALVIVVRPMHQTKVAPSQAVVEEVKSVPAKENGNA